MEKDSPQKLPLSFSVTPLLTLALSLLISIFLGVLLDSPRRRYTLRQYIEQIKKQDMVKVRKEDAAAKSDEIVVISHMPQFTLYMLTTQQKNGGWFGFIPDAMEVILKVFKDGLSALHVPYSYGLAIILLTIIVKVATLPLTKQQVESQLAMQNLQPKLKAIQERYPGNQERIQLETARLYKQARVNPLAGCLPTLATIPVWIGLYQALSNVANEGY